MGGGSRKLTVENKDTDVLKISQKVIERLRKENLTKGSKKPLPLDLETQVEIAKSLSYWKTRLQKTRSDQEYINNRLQEQYDKTCRDFEEPPPKKPDKNVAKEMKKLQSALIKCYKANPKQSLNCAKEVENFNSWFEDTREKGKKQQEEEKEKKKLEEKEKSKLPEKDKKGKKKDKKEKEPEEPKSDCPTTSEEE